jgi:hypothetical protein
LIFAVYCVPLAICATAVWLIGSRQNLARG